MTLTATDLVTLLLLHLTNFTQEMQNYIRQCHACAMNKATKHLQYGLHPPLLVPTTLYGIFPGLHTYHLSQIRQTPGLTDRLIGFRQF